MIRYFLDLISRTIGEVSKEFVDDGAIGTEEKKKLMFVSEEREGERERERERESSNIEITRIR